MLTIPGKRLSVLVERVTKDSSQNYFVMYALVTFISSILPPSINN